MNPAYQQVRFRATLPESGLPLRFGIVTACNPEGRKFSDAENSQATGVFEQQLKQAGLMIFPVVGGSADFSHAEPGFGIILSDPKEAVALGRQWRQEAIFWVKEGIVTLMPCGPGEPCVLGPWSQFTEPPADRPAFYFLGNIELLKQPKTAFFCSVRCPGSAILTIFDQATKWRDEGRCIISGFHSPVEKECLGILLRGEQPIVICPARSLPKRIPKEWQEALQAGRLLVLSAFSSNVNRPDTERAHQRNEFVATLADKIYIGHATAGGQVERLASRFTTAQAF